VGDIAGDQLVSLGSADCWMESYEKIPSVPSSSSVGRGQEGVSNSGWKVFRLRTSGDWRIFGLNAERVYGERVSGEEGDLERVSMGGLGPETEINLLET